ncbi:fec80a45-8598-405e-9f90-1684910d6306 [Sclerotinia trifoliorum]|uniref:Fec80a45-8598-405e-9f90-1684910d6306 n=1 Tax=Sclerotinia trifoliorum TaxID=28548 RepID=A0A8H2VU70_9HELO|nr:fec80a45-8598-405e-9f90-1684910d6306 [Sclerotinia trifoliorum]
MTASNLATCRVRLPPLNEKKNEDPNLNLNSLSDHELHTKWANAIQKLFSPDANPDTKSSPHTQIRYFDILLHKDGSAENLIKNQQTSQKSKPETQPYRYPPRYQLPDAISARLTTNEEKISRAECFALGSILYEISSGHPLFHDVDEAGESGNSGFGSGIQDRILIGKFPEDLWDSSLLSRILVCWCPEFLKEMVSLSEKEKGNEKGNEKENEGGNENRNEEDTGITNYIKTHPYRFTFQVVGGLLTAASIAAVPVLGAIGFSAAGPVAGSAAAAWQSGVGLVEAGSIFAWCQSVAMGGAAVSGIIGAGVGGAGLWLGRRA